MDKLIRRKVLISMLFIGLTMMGLFSYKYLPMELYPDAEYPTLNVNVTTRTGTDLDPNYLLNQAAIPVEGAISGMEGVKRVYGRRTSFQVPVEISGAAEGFGAAESSGAADLISYDDFGLDCLKKDDMLKKGSDISKVYGDSGYVLATSDADSLLRIGDKVKIGAEELEIAGLLKYDPFSSDGLTQIFVWPCLLMRRQ